MPKIVDREAHARDLAARAIPVFAENEHRRMTFPKDPTQLSQPNTPTT